MDLLQNLVTFVSSWRFLKTNKDYKILFKTYEMNWRLLRPKNYWWLLKTIEQPFEDRIIKSFILVWKEIAQKISLLYIHCLSITAWFTIGQHFNIVLVPVYQRLLSCKHTDTCRTWTHDDTCAGDIGQHCHISQLWHRHLNTFHTRHITVFDNLSSDNIV